MTLTEINTMLDAEVLQENPPIPAKVEPVHLPPVIMTSCGKLATALAKVMGEIGVVAKQGHNAFHDYKYVKMEDLLQRATPLLAEHGIVILQTEVDRSLFDNDKAIAIKYAFTLVHSSGEVWPERLYQTGLSTCRHRNGTFDDKAMNKAHTAARKYFLLALLQIPTGDEMDDADSGEAPERHTKDKQEPKFTRAENAAVNWDIKFAKFKAEVQSITDYDKWLNWNNINAREISGFPPHMLKEIRETSELQRQLIKSASVSGQVVHDTDGPEPRAATPEDIEPEPKVLISQAAIDARERRAPRLQEIDPATGLPVGIDQPRAPRGRPPNPDKWLAGLQMAADTADSLESLSKVQIELMMPQRTRMPDAVWNSAIAIFANRASALGKPEDKPEPETFDTADWLTQLDGALAGCEGMEELREIKERVLLPAKGQVSGPEWEAGANKYRERLAELSRADILRI